SSAGSKGHTFSCSSAPLAKPAASKHPEMRGRLRIGCRYQWRGGRPRQAPARTSSCASEPGTPPRDARVPLGTVDRWTQCQTGMTHSAGVCVMSLSSPVASRQLGHEARARGGTAPGRRRRSEGRGRRPRARPEEEQRENRQEPIIRETESGGSTSLHGALRPTAALPSCPLTADGSQGGSWHCRKTGSG
ncbi:unnamed protein product, partial [Prorocentrum cordatum]